MPDDASGATSRLRATASRLALEGPRPGASWCAEWTAAVDATLRALVADCPPELVRDGAIVAVGGYGRGELCPASDIDLLLLHDGLERSSLEQLVRTVVYPLWDVGLTVGYAVRDRREAVAATDELDAATALLDARDIAGATGLSARVRSEALRRLVRRPQRFLSLLMAADDERHAGALAPTEALEPDLKLGAGGLRDIQSLRWAAAALVGTPGLEPLVPAGIIGAPDLPRLRGAEDRLLAARVALHLAQAERAGRADAPARVPSKEDVVRFEHHEAVAQRLGYEDIGPEQLGPHRLLRDLALAARTIEHIHRRAWALIGSDLVRGRRRRTRPSDHRVGGFELADGVLRIPESDDLAAPDLPVRLLAALAGTGAILDRRSAGRLRVHATDRTDDAGAATWGLGVGEGRTVQQVLWAGRTALPALAELDDTGVLTALLPEWEPTRGRTQRNPYHRFTLDRHGWNAAVELAELVRREPWAAETFERVADRDALMLAAVLHDVGKAIGEPHAETGVEPARRLARRLGASERTAEEVGDLVRLHLLLPDTARRRDLADPAVVADISEQVGTPSRLAALHLLAVADGRATGPTAWNDWVGSLVTTLVRKAAAVLDGSTPDPLGDDAATTARAAQELAVELGATADAVRDHLARMSSRYAAAVTPRAVVRHTLMAATTPATGELRTRVTPGAQDPDGVEGVDELDVVALDAPGWFAKVAGVLALHGGQVLAADAFARTDGIAIDTFRVLRPEGATGSWWARVEGDLVDAAVGRLAVRARVARKARENAPRPGRHPDVATEVTFSDDPAGRSTVVEVRTADRLGVLYAIAGAIAELELDIVVARIQTVGHEATDVFTLRDRTDGPLDPDQCSELELAVIEALSQLDR